MKNPTLHVRIISPKEVILDTEAFAVSSKNLQGSFDILPSHANFITIIENQPITIKFKKDKPITFQFHTAVIFVSSNMVNVYIPLN